jgi:hypothetical protein
MDIKLLEIFNKVINDKYKINKHKKYYSNEYYINHIFEILNDANKWKILSNFKSYEPVLINNKLAKSHFDTIRKKFVKWNNDGIFKFTFDECIIVSPV